MVSAHAAVGQVSTADGARHALPIAEQYGFRMEASHRPELYRHDTVADAQPFQDRTLIAIGARCAIGIGENGEARISCRPQLPQQDRLDKQEVDVVGEDDRLARVSELLAEPT